jgi:pilus assembly protein Flp/PilA
MEVKWSPWPDRPLVQLIRQADRVQSSLNPKGPPTMFSILKTSVVNFLKREDGPTAVEYAVMLALIIVVCIAAITALGSNANVTFTEVSNTVAGTGS